MPARRPPTSTAPPEALGMAVAMKAMAGQLLLGGAGCGQRSSRKLVDDSFCLPAAAMSHYHDLNGTLPRRRNYCKLPYLRLPLCVQVSVSTCLTESLKISRKNLPTTNKALTHYCRLRGLAVFVESLCGQGYDDFRPTSGKIRCSHPIFTTSNIRWCTPDITVVWSPPLNGVG